MTGGDGDGAPFQYGRGESGMVELNSLRHCCRRHSGGGTGPPLLNKKSRCGGGDETEEMGAGVVWGGGDAGGGGGEVSEGAREEADEESGRRDGRECGRNHSKMGNGDDTTKVGSDSSSKVAPTTTLPQWGDATPWTPWDGTSPGSGGSERGIAPQWPPLPPLGETEGGEEDAERGASSRWRTETMVLDGGSGEGGGKQ